MPAIGAFDEIDVEEGTGSALDRGSYVHRILELFVSTKKETIEELKEIAKKLLKTEFLHKISEKDFEEAIQLGKVFLNRNLPLIRSAKKSKTELAIDFNIEGYKFYGKVDRTDYLSKDKEGFVDIIDYKTGKLKVGPKPREIQLGIYALGLQNKGLKINQISLDMLKLDNPIIMEIDKDNQDDVTAKLGCNKSSNFKLSELKQYLLDTCKKIERDYETDFTPIGNKDKCKFCGYKFYCPKWKE
jgi:CRISPR/Cas system-associated exonuclease Cas4 (RecB family)